MKNKVLMIVCIVIALSIVVGVILKFPTQNRTEERLKTKLLDTAKELFETDKWTKGGITPDTYVATLDDLKNKLGKDISLFEKYDCDKKNTRVEFVVMKQQKANQTNYKYNIILDCQF